MKISKFEKSSTVENCEKFLDTHSLTITIVRVIFQAMYWSLGAALLEDGRLKFDAFIKYLASLTIINDEGINAGAGKT